MYRGLFIADIHIGALSLDQTYKECEYLKNLLRQYTKDSLLDFIIIGGDYFDKQFYTSDMYVDIAQRLMIWLLTSTRVLRCIYGTSSHDSEQYKLFNPLISAVSELTNTIPIDFKVVTTVSEEELLPGMKVLYVPEEYIYNKNDYYKEFLLKENEYDYIFGHGVIQEIFGNKISSAKKDDSKRLKPATFTAGELSYACRGNVIFGHYHLHTENRNVSYVGSWSRWKQDEEPDKGLFQLSFDPDTGNNMKEFIVNSTALKYVTISYGYEDSVFKTSDKWADTVLEIKKIKLKKCIYKLRVIFNIPVGYEMAESFIKFFREAFNEYTDINIDFSHGYVEKKAKLSKENVSSLPEEYKIFLDKNVPQEVKMALFIKLKRGVEYDPEIIKKYTDLT